MEVGLAKAGSSELGSFSGLLESTTKPKKEGKTQKESGFRGRLIVQTK